LTVFIWYFEALLFNGGDMESIYLLIII